MSRIEQKHPVTTDGKPRSFPPWLKARLPVEPSANTRHILNELKVNTVCREARCPNLGECWSRGTATFMILGRHCTRNCRFCSVGHQTPSSVDPTEPQRIADAVRRMKLTHVVITSVTRDDLPDEGAGQFAEVVTECKRCGTATVEVLTPDFHAKEDLIQIVLDAKPDVFNHNLETTEALHKTIRPDANYRQSLDVLATAKRLAPDTLVKSGLMVGFGETPDDVHRALDDLKAAGADMLTIGQYLQPNAESNVPVVEYVHPDQFEAYANYAKAIGFLSVASGPLVRSSYMADASKDAAVNQRDNQKG